MGTNPKGKAAGAILIACGMVAGFEGLQRTAYQDVSPAKVWTVCYGETRGVRPGETHTKGECDEMLAARLVEFDEGIRSCLKDPVPDSTRAAFISFAYWKGTSGFCRSIVAAKWNADDRVGACNALTLDKYTRAGGVQFRGLVNRRKVERDYCLEGL
jgi:lysozyme